MAVAPSTVSVTCPVCRELLDVPVSMVLDKAIGSIASVSMTLETEVLAAHVAEHVASDGEQGNGAS